MKRRGGPPARPFKAHPRHPLTGIQFTVSAATERELEALLHRIDTLRQELKLNMRSPDDVDRTLRRLRFGPITLARAAEAYQRREDLAGETRRRVRGLIAGPLRDLAPLELDALEPLRLAPVFERLSRTQSRRTLVTTWRSITAILAFAAERGWTARVPWGAWKPRARGTEGRPTRECCRTVAERSSLILAGQALDREDLAAGRRYRGLGALIAAASLVGLRQGELAGLRWYDVYLDRSVVGVRRQYEGRPVKQGESAEVAGPLFELFDVLRAHAGELAHTLGLPVDQVLGHGLAVFPAPGLKPPRGSLYPVAHYRRGEPLPAAWLREAVDRAGLPNVGRWTAHSLRDSFATIEYRRLGGDLPALMLRTRHRSLGSLMRYLRTLNRTLELAPPAEARSVPALPP